MYWYGLTICVMAEHVDAVNAVKSPVAENQFLWKAVMKMVDVQQFEGLLESLQGEIDDLPEGTSKSNLSGICDGLYSIFEALEDISASGLFDEYDIIKELLTDRLSYDEKLYYKIKYHIDLGV